ncbi:MAG TPA: ATP-binding protein [Kouleothrix sp.]|nr:ATP-binding protein [Kouleothrix sp.]
MARMRWSTSHTRPYTLRQRRRGRERIQALEQQVAELRAQLATQWVQAQPTPGTRLDTLLTLCSALLVTHDLPAILQLVVQQAKALFVGASGALLFLSDTTGQMLELRATSAGTLPPMRVYPGQSTAGRAFLAPRAMLMAGPELALALDEQQPAQYAELSNLLTHWPPVSALLAPLRLESQRLGSLVIYGGSRAQPFVPRDLPFVQALADMVAIAIVDVEERNRTTQLASQLTQTQTNYAEIQARLDTAQAQLLQSAKLAAVGELAASVAHEINNPLYAARNSLYVVEQDLAADAPERAFIAVAQAELGRIARIITRMRDFYRPTRTELEPTCLNEVLRATIELVHTHLRHGHVTIQHELDAQLPQIVAHADQLRQVFLNLMLNACDAMPTGGVLTIRSTNEPGDASAASIVAIQISDTGSGIDPEHLPHIFEPFYTTKAQGTGLGLAISAHIINQHGGCIAVASTLGQGSTFTIHLPFTPPPTVVLSMYSTLS